MKRKIALQALFIWMICVVLIACTSKADPDITVTMVRNRSGLMVSPEFFPLKPGAINPEGWIRDWAREAGSGITGHLDEYSPTFGEAWKGYGFKAMGATANGGGCQTGLYLKGFGLNPKGFGQARHSSGWSVKKRR
jgi:hypothetical protein